MTEPVLPPTMDEIREIVTRRKRRNLRAAEGAVGLVAVAGLSVASVNRPGVFGLDSNSSDVTAGLAEAATPGLPVGAFSKPVGDLSAPAVAVDSVTMAAFLEEARNAYLSSDQIDRSDAVLLADEWELSLHEVKAVLGLFYRSDVRWGPDLEPISELSIDVIIDGFLFMGMDLPHALVMAEDWQVSTRASKVISVEMNLLGLDPSEHLSDSALALWPETVPAEHGDQSTGGGEPWRTSIDDIGFGYYNAGNHDWAATEQLAAEWQIEPANTKAIVGFADHRGDAGFTELTADEIIAAYEAGGLGLVEAEELSREWLVPLFAAKAHALLGLRAGEHYPFGADLADNPPAGPIATWLDDAASDYIANNPDALDVASRMAQEWFVNDLREVKAALGLAEQRGIDGGAIDGLTVINEFEAAGYKTSYADALAAEWGVEHFAAKAIAVMLVRAGEELPTTVPPARSVPAPLTGEGGN